MNRIRYFSVLVESRHVRKAAEILHMNPASLSRAIKILEDEVGFKLVMPVGRGIEITDRGMTLYKKSRRLLEEYNAFVASAKDQESERAKTIKLGSMEVFTTYFLSQFIQKYAPEQKMHVRYLTPGRMEEALKQREIDIGLTYIRLADMELNYLKVGKFRMQIFGLKSMMAKKLAELPFAIPINGINTASISLRGLDGWPDDAFPRQVKYEFELLETALQTAATGHAVVFCPDFVVKLHNQFVQNQFKLVALPLPTGFRSKELSVYVVTRKNEEENDIIRKLARASRELA